jgi:hypothetical protein
VHSEVSGERRRNSKGNAGLAVNGKAYLIADSRLEADSVKSLFLKQQKGTLRLSVCYAMQSRSGLQAPMCPISYTPIFIYLIFVTRPPSYIVNSNSMELSTTREATRC